MYLLSCVENMKALNGQKDHGIPDLPNTIICTCPRYRTRPYPDRPTDQKHPSPEIQSESTHKKRNNKLLSPMHACLVSRLGNDKIIKEGRGWWRI